MSKNIEKTAVKSPLRYPGGKSRAVKILYRYIPENTKEYVKKLGHDYDCTVIFDPHGEKTLNGRNLPSIQFTIISPSRQPSLSGTYSAKISFYPTTQKKVGIDKHIIQNIFEEESSEFDVNLSKITRESVKEKITRLIKESCGTD